MKGRDTSWNEVARWYDQLVGERGSDYHQNLIFPGALRLLDTRSGEKVLDVGCGQGVFCLKLAELELKVTGVDASKKLIQLAERHSAKFPNLKYYIADAARLEALGNESFDAATCIMAIQNMESVHLVFKEVARVLKSTGRFVLVMSHPCFRIPRQSGWGFDEKRKLQYRRIDSYLSSQKIPIQMQPGYAPQIYTWTFHRPLSEYFTALAETGFLVEQLEEWASHRISQPGSKKRAEDRSRQEIPLFLALKARKI